MTSRPDVPTLTMRALNRATLARQMLLARENTPTLGAIERLVALQAQLARPPFIGLWSRIEGFQREDLTRLLERREVVRATLMRGTLHLMSAKDYVSQRAALQPVLDRGMQSVLRERVEGLDVGRWVAAARAYFDEKPRTFDELRDFLAGLDPEGDVRAMGYAVRCKLPLIQVPTDAAWGYPGKADFAVAESWLGEPLGAGDLQALVARYLAAFGPATAGDMQTWSGLQGLRDAFEALRPKLCAFRDERRKELFDLPNAPRPAEDTPAPARFLPEFDSLVMAHADRTRFVAEAHRSAIFRPNLLVPAMFLVDGSVAGTWTIERKKASAALVIAPFDALSKKAREELTDEGNKLVRFVEADARAFDVRFAKSPPKQRK